jgi:hypothetical protein
MAFGEAAAMLVQLGVGVVEAPRLTACGPEDDDDYRCAVCVWMNLNSQEHVSPHVRALTPHLSRRGSPWPHFAVSRQTFVTGRCC